MKTLMRFAIVLLVLTSQSGPVSSQTLTTLYQFGGVAGDGAQPVATLVQGSDGNFYGTTFGGGTNSDGTVFKITPQGTLTTLYQFGGLVTDGQDALAGLVQGNDGNFYGTTQFGGTNESIYDNNGTVFRINSAGALTTLYQFGGLATDGTTPLGALVQTSDGWFYGTTQTGGTNDHGTVFRINSAGALTTLCQFGDIAPDAYDAFAGLTRGSDGNFYGTSFYGGTNDYFPTGNTFLGGTVYRVSTAGTLTTLYSFGVSLADGINPIAGLVQGSDGNFYGTTLQGGTNNVGTAFRVSPAGMSCTLYQFGGVASDGAGPVANPVQGSDGNFYGTTSRGGTNNLGTVFRINSAGSLTTLYQFTGIASNGTLPEANLVQGSDGAFYGTTQYGGTNNAGTVFRFCVPLSPPPWPINQITGSQLTGASAVFSVPSVAGETYQLQYSSSMSPPTWSNVPAASVTNSIGALMTVTNFGAASQPQGFYRFQITP